MSSLTVYLQPLKSPSLPCPEQESLFRPDKGSAGDDIRSVQDVLLPARSRKTLDTGVMMAMPPGLCGLLISRSGLSSKHGIQVGAGLIDPYYRGKIGVVLYNHSDTDYSVKAGDRIAQLLFVEYCSPALVLVENINSIPTTSRGSQGFGSSGIS